MSLVSSLNAQRMDSPTGGKNEKGQRIYTQMWDVYCDSSNDGPKTIMDHASIPQIGDPYAFGSEVDPGAILVNVGLSRFSPPSLASGSSVLWRWQLKLDYKVADPAEGDENPLLRPVEIRGGAALFVNQTTKDKDGNVMKNAATEALPPTDIDDAMFEVEFVRNESSSPASFIPSYINHINSFTIWGGDVHTWKCQDIRYEKKTEGIYTYWQVTYRFRYNPDSYVLQRVNEGFNYKDGSTLKPILLSDKTKPSEPFKLTAAGAQASDTADPNYLDFDVYEEANFSALGLPSVI